ncbi:MAG: cation diffusion facilitator family transporter [Bacteroidales bacterium]|nr:cation diffusion facilitator family transporter [Bacteroidales bacterium]
MKAEERNKDLKSITIKGMVVNIVLIILKLVVGFLGKSAALIADAIHSASDLITDVIVLVGSFFGNKPKDSNHNFGHGKIETLSTALVATVLLGAAVYIFYAGAVNIINHLNGNHIEKPNFITLIIAGISIISKEILYQLTVKVGNRINSKMLIANAWHHRSDALSSIGVFLGIGGALILGDKWVILDPLAAMLVSVFIFLLAFKLIRDSLKELIETSLPIDIQTEILSIAENVEGVIKPHNLKTRNVGNQIAIDMHIYVEDHLNIVEAHDISRDVESSLKERFGEESFISVHVEPKNIIK